VTKTAQTAPETPPSGRVERFLLWIERVGNRLPDTAVLFVIALFAVWVVSAIFSGHEFEVPAAGEPRRLTIQNQLTGTALATFLATMVQTFTGFAPLGVVLVALLGVGVAEHVGFIGAALRAVLAVTPRRLLTPMLLLVAVMSHTAADAGYVLVIPLGGVIFRAAGRHPLAGIACAFAGVSGGFAANFIPSGIDPLLQGFTQQAAQLIDPARVVNPLCNWGFTSASSILIILLGWFITDRVVEPRLRSTPIVEGAGPELRFERLEPRERRGLIAATMAMVAGIAIIALAAAPADSPLRNPAGLLTAFDAPLMQSIVPLIFLLFLLPAAIYGYIARTITSHRDLIAGMTKTMSSMGYYLAMIFFAAQFTAAFGRSNLGALLSVEGADVLQRLGLPGAVTIVGIILLAIIVDLLIGSASAKWAVLAPIFVPILMQVGLSPELTQAAYRVGDSVVNIITPLMPYFPLVVAFSQRWVKTTGIGTLVSLMLPYSVTFGVCWTLFLLAYWALGIPLGIAAPYHYP
jgi:aminobenzoyl-glutamate transport protein